MHKSGPPVWLKDNLEIFFVCKIINFHITKISRINPSRYLSPLVAIFIRQ